MILIFERTLKSEGNSKVYSTICRVNVENKVLPFAMKQWREAFSPFLIRASHWMTCWTNIPKSNFCSYDLLRIWRRQIKFFFSTASVVTVWVSMVNLLLQCLLLFPKGIGKNTTGTCLTFIQGTMRIQSRSVAACSCTAWQVHAISVSRECLEYLDKNIPSALFLGLKWVFYYFFSWKRYVCHKSNITLSWNWEFSGA